MASTCNKSFSSNYMLLKPEDAGFLDLAKMLFSSDLGKRKFIDCPEGAREPFGRRWIIFISVMVQKLLQATAKPMASFGSGVENWLNLLSGNGGFFGLVMNALKGTNEHIMKSSTSRQNIGKFLSFIGNIDKRLELDSNISHGDKRYFAALSVMASKASYENQKYIESIVQDHWKGKLINILHFSADYQEKATTQAFVLEDKNDVIVVAFRGTEPFDADAWSSDFDLSWYELPGAGKIHGGFMKALGLQKNQGWPQEQDDNKPDTAYYAIRKLLKERLQKSDNAKFIVTGHSLGGALAALFPTILSLHEESWLLDRLEGVYTFGQPRVGDEVFGQYMKNIIEKHNINFYRFVYSYDLVPRLPYDDKTLMFKHFGTCIYYNSLYEGKVVAEEPDKNYFSLIWLIPKLINACWELIRSFIIGYTKGADYKEGGLLRMFRVMGILAAGVPNHCPQDYVNATRLGSADVFNSSVLGSNHHKILKMQ
ncbi:putative feruloyl esterase A [Sesamum angolense]|uniref:Feruloyl esterase A n=1 Tax=Sesamum angolense TaxID=2727404 RepID=A0AAE1WGY3_9LAMI|nr:putative feruloyl esterase A [Sesamum angolense]